MVYEMGVAIHVSTLLFDCSYPTQNHLFKFTSKHLPIHTILAC